MFQRSGGQNRCFELAAKNIVTAKNIRLSQFASTLDLQTLGTETPRGFTVYSTGHCTGHSTVLFEPASSLSRCASSFF